MLAKQQHQEEQEARGDDVAQDLVPRQGQALPRPSVAMSLSFKRQLAMQADKHYYSSCVKGATDHLYSSLLRCVGSSCSGSGSSGGRLWMCELQRSLEVEIDTDIAGAHIDTEVDTHGGGGASARALGALAFTASAHRRCARWRGVYSATSR